jgi:hypothetical protein
MPDGTVATYTPEASTPTTILDAASGVLGAIAAPESESGVLGDIAAPLTGDDLSPRFYLLMAGLALIILITIIAVTRRRRY